MIEHIGASIGIGALHLTPHASLTLFCSTIFLIPCSASDKSMLYFYREEIRKDRMPTLEERLEALERALSTIRAEQISDIRQLDERISALHQQVAEQRRRLSERDQDLQQKFDCALRCPGSAIWCYQCALRCPGHEPTSAFYLYRCPV